MLVSGVLTYINRGAMHLVPAKAWGGLRWGGALVVDFVSFSCILALGMYTG